MLTKGELKIMRVLWRRGSATAREVLEELSSGQKTAYTTVQTMLNILQRKGVVTASKDGRAHRFTPVLSRTKAQALAVRDLVEQFFDRSSAALAQHIVDSGSMDEMQLEELKDLIEEQGDD